MLGWKRVSIFVLGKVDIVWRMVNGVIFVFFEEYGADIIHPFADTTHDHHEARDKNYDQTSNGDKNSVFHRLNMNQERAGSQASNPPENLFQPRFLRLLQHTK